MWKPKDRQIFRYWDGSKERYADPLQVIRKIASIEDLDLEADEAKADMGDMSALARIVDAVRDAFSISPYSEDEQGEPQGLLDNEVLQVCRDFSGYMIDLKKSVEQNQNLQPTTQDVLATSTTS